MDIKGDRMITRIFCSWKEFDEYQLDIKYNLVDFGEDEKRPGYRWLCDVKNNVSVYVR